MSDVVSTLGQAWHRASIEIAESPIPVDKFTIPTDTRLVGGYNVVVDGDDIIIALRKTDDFITVRYDCAIVLPMKQARWLAVHLERLTRSVHPEVEQVPA